MTTILTVAVSIGFFGMGIVFAIHGYWFEKMGKYSEGQHKEQ